MILKLFLSIVLMALMWAAAVALFFIGWRKEKK